MISNITSEMLCASASYIIPDFLRITSVSTVIVPSEKSVWFNFTTQACYGIKFTILLQETLTF